MGGVTVKRFDPAVNSSAWDSFVSNKAVNSSFIHLRSYMDYHADRFTDYSLLVTDSHGKITAVLPAVKSDGEVVSHPGLTFGGLLTDSNCHHADIAVILDSLCSFLKNDGIRQLTITQPPFIYQSKPTQDVEYILSTRFNGTITRRRLLSVIDLNSGSKLSTLRKRCAARAQRASLTPGPSDDLDAFYVMLTTNLAERHNATPVHSLDEIKLLARRFPDNIKPFIISDGTRLVGSTLLYISGQVVKTQYIASTTDGRDKGAVDLLLMSVIEMARQKGYRYLDLGSSESSPGIINSGLLFQKEGFGAGGVCLDTYTVNIK